MNLVYGGAPVEVKGLGSQGRCTMIEQEDKNRYCINMMYVSPAKRGRAEIIEDILPVYNIKCTLKTDKKIKNVYLGLTNEKLDFVQEDNKVSFTVPELVCHTSVVVEY